MQTDRQTLNTGLLSNTAIVISTEAPNAYENQPGVGDIDYAISLHHELLKNGYSNIKFCQSDTKTILESTLENSTNTIFHLMINSPRTGFAIDTNYLQSLKSRNCKIVISAFEFAKYYEEDKRKTIDYLKCADQIIFLDEIDRDEAVKYCEKNNFSKEFTHTIKKSTIINVPATIASEYVTKYKSDSNIMCFGMVRTSKGFPHILQLARELKQNENDFIRNKFIYVVGTVAKHKTKNKGTEYDPTLPYLLCQMYPQYEDKIMGKSPAELIAWYNSIKNEKPDLPIKLFFDTPESELGRLFEQCEYAFYPADRGATLRNCSISTDFAFGCIIYSHLTDITPPSLCSNGQFSKSIVLINDSDINTYAREVVNDIVKRELNKRTIKDNDECLNSITLAHANRLLTEELSLAMFVEKHLQTYVAAQVDNKLLNTAKYTYATLPTLFEQKNPSTPTVDNEHKTSFGMEM